MNVRLAMLSLGGAFALAAAPLAGAAQSMSLNGFRHHVLPVLVTVDSHGRVTRMDPAYELRPKMKKAVRHTVDAMITGPAVWKHKPIASQMIINLALNAEPRDDGNYDVRWMYAGKQPVPYDPSWVWSHIDGHRLALQRASDIRHRIRHVPVRRPPPSNGWRRYSNGQNQQPSRGTPATRQAPVRNHSSSGAHRH